METVKIPHAELSYDERRHINDFARFDWTKATKHDSVDFSRALGFKETGMSVNEVALLYDLLEKRRPQVMVELGRNYGTSTRLFIQHIIRHGGSLHSWDLKHWEGFVEGLTKCGYAFHAYQEGGDIAFGPLEIHTGARLDVRLLIRDSMKSPIVSPKENDDRFVDFLLIDTEHGLEHALGEYMRWRNYLTSGSMIAFHDSELPGPKRAIELIKEVEEMASPGGNTFVREYVNERVDGYGIHVLERKG